LTPSMIQVSSSINYRVFPAGSFDARILVETATLAGAVIGSGQFLS
jgi:hypothetical protein